MTDHVDTAIAAAEIFERTGIPYALVGSVASAFVGEPRNTVDVDFAVMMSVGKIGSFVEAASVGFSVQQDAVEEAVLVRRIFNIVDRRNFVKVDVHVVPDRAVYRAEIERARWMRLSKTSQDAIRVATPEDLVIQKVMWFRSGGEQSDRQWRDVVGILKVRRGGLDLGYLRKWGREEEILDLLERALREADVPGARGGATHEEKKPC
jgi:hypothetical protein